MTFFLNFKSNIKYKNVVIFSLNLREVLIECLEMLWIYKILIKNHTQMRYLLMVHQLEYNK
jgi:phenylacetate-coenzyme A ligase PaaK-like adenylate-forming protein